MNYISMLKTSTSDFWGISVVLAVAGCVHKCEGCWAKANGGWKFNSGDVFDEEAYELLSSYLTKPYVDNLVIQGGDGLVPRNRKPTIELCKRIKANFPTKRIVVFTGYTFEEVTEFPESSELFKVMDVLVDGKYIKDLYDPEVLYRGSSNQRILWLDDKGNITKEK